MVEAFDVVLSCVEDEMTLFSKRERKGAVTGILLKSMVVGQNWALRFLQLCFSFYATVTRNQRRASMV